MRIWQKEEDAKDLTEGILENSEENVKEGAYEIPGRVCANTRTNMPQRRRRDRRGQGTGRGRRPHPGRSSIRIPDGNMKINSVRMHRIVSDTSRYMTGAIRQMDAI